MREAIPYAKVIWEFDASWEITMKKVAPALKFEEIAKTGISNGRYTLDTNAVCGDR